jgi:hypothetical protein
MTTIEIILFRMGLNKEAKTAMNPAAKDGTVNLSAIPRHH